MNIWIKSLVDFDFDYPTNIYPGIGTKLSRDDGKVHPVATSLVDINFHPTKYSCDRLGIPHIDILPSHILNGIDFNKIPPLHKLEPLVPYVVKNPHGLYHLQDWCIDDLRKFNPKTIEELALFIGLIRPKIRQLFLNTGHKVVFNNDADKHTHNGMIVYQEDMMNIISTLFKVSLDKAELMRKSGDFGDYESNDLFMSLYKTINKHCMAKGHCLQVVFIILSQCYMKGV